MIPQPPSPPPPPPPSSLHQEGNNQVFHAELPSECNLYLSSKRCIQQQLLVIPGSPTPGAGSDDDNLLEKPPDSVAIIKFATERHSIALLMQDNTTRIHERDSYSLSCTRLPQLKSATKKAAAAANTTTKKSNLITEPESSVDTCLAHSSIAVVLRDYDVAPQSSPELSVEVFAMMRTTTKDPSTIDKATMYRSHAVSESATRDDDAGGGDLILSSGGRKISTDASVATMISAISTLKNDMTADDDNNATTVKFYLLVKMMTMMHGGRSSGGYVSEQQINSSPPTTATSLSSSSSRTSFKERIALDFRPMLVHAADIHVVTTSSTTTTSGDIHPTSSSSSRSYIGIFVTSVDDNRLRLFIKDTKSNSRVVPITLLNDTASSPSDTNDIDTHEHHCIDDPLVFSSPIMAVDSRVTEEGCIISSNGEKISVKVNRLAIACYDGTVRILTYRMIINQKDDDGNESPFQFCTLRCSRFIVDGPVASLQFGVTNYASRLFSLLETPSLFLVAGSLCGFACVFYEALLPSADRFFDGPLLVIDGLDDGQQEGYVDSVTAVHVSNHKTQQVIMVGTQSGRVLVLKQCDKERMIWKRIEAEVLRHRQERDELQYQIGQQTKQISLLKTKKESMATKAHDLRTTISVIQTKSDDLSQSKELTCESHIGNGSNIDAESKELPVEDEFINCIEDGAEIGQSLSNSDAVLDSPTSNSETNTSTHTTTTTMMTQMELAVLERGIAGMESNISELSTGLIDIEKRIADCEEKADRLSKSLLHSINLRKLHHYELFRDYHFPYPIHGILSRHRGEGYAGKREIFVTTMRSFHILLLDEIATYCDSGGGGV